MMRDGVVSRLAVAATERARSGPLRGTQIQPRLGVERRMDADRAPGAHRHVLGLDRLSAVDSEPFDGVRARFEGDGEIAAFGFQGQVSRSAFASVNRVELRSGRSSMSTRLTRSAYRTVSPMAKRAGLNVSNDIRTAGPRVRRVHPADQPEVHQDTSEPFNSILCRLGFGSFSGRVKQQTQCRPSRRHGREPAPHGEPAV